MQKHYTNGEVTILWQPTLCIHSGNCVRSLSSVFRPKERPWIQPEHALNSEEIITAVHRCPSGALTIAEGPHEPLQSSPDRIVSL